MKHPPARCRSSPEKYPLTETPALIWIIAAGLAQDPELIRGGATAIIAVNDMLAIGAMDALLEQGFRVPEDYSIIGFDNLLYTGLERISLTTVDPHADMLAQSAMDVLLHRLNILMPDSLVSHMRFKAECQPRLIVRHSTAKIEQ